MHRKRAIMSGTKCLSSQVPGTAQKAGSQSGLHSEFHIILNLNKWRETSERLKQCALKCGDLDINGIFPGKSISRQWMITLDIWEYTDRINWIYWVKKIMMTKNCFGYLSGGGFVRRWRNSWILWRHNVYYSMYACIYTYNYLLSFYLLSH